MPGNFAVVRKYRMKKVKGAEEDWVNLPGKKGLSDPYTGHILCDAAELPSVRFQQKE